MQTLKKIRAFLLNPHFWIWLFPLLLITPNIGLCITEYNSIWARLANIFLPLAVYLCIVSLWKRLGVIIWILFPLLILCAFQIVLLYLYGESIIAIDMFMNVVTTNPEEAGELLGNLKIAIFTVVILYVPVLTMAVYFIVKRRFTSAEMRRKTLFAAIPAGAIGVVFYIIALICCGCRPGREIFPVNVVYNMVTAGVRLNESMNYHHTSENFSYDASTTRPTSEREIYVFVIGETSRADNWQLFGYDRPTNPKLAQRQGVTVFPYTMSQINTTHKSVPMLLSPLTSETFGDSVAHIRSIFAAYNDVGYNTAFFSNQRRNHSYIDYYGCEAQTAKFLSDSIGPGPDLNLVAALDRFISGSPSNKIFVVLHTYGSHFEYRKRYPKSMAYFQPDKNSEASRINRTQLLNAYDNTIRYTDALVDSVIATVNRQNAVSAVVYVSDHGEDIFDDSRERFLHSSPVPTFYQLHVPLVVWTSDSLRTLYPNIGQALQSNSQKHVSSSRAVFHTLLNLSGIHTREYLDGESLASPRYTPKPFTYLNDYNESVPLSESGMRSGDFDAMHSAHF